MKTIYRTNKYYNVHPATVRSSLKKLGYRIGTMGSNGRIRGMSTFSGGSVQVKEFPVSRPIFTESSKVFRYLYQNYDVFVEVAVHNDNVDIKDLQKDLEKLGYKVEENGHSLVVSK